MFHVPYHHHHHPVPPQHHPAPLPPTTPTSLHPHPPTLQTLHAPNPSTLSLAGAATSIILVATKLLSWQAYFCHNRHVFVSTKHIFCCDKSMLVTTKPLSRQSYFCCNKTCHDKYLSWQTFSHNKLTFVMTSTCLSQQNMCFVVTKVNVATNFLSQQTHVCPDKYMSWQNFCCNKHNSFMTKLWLWQAYFCCKRKHVLSQQTYVCHDKTFVMTKMVLVAAPANNITQHPLPYQMRPKLVLTFDWCAHLACRSEAGDHLSVERKHSSSSNVGHDPQARPISVQVDQTPCHVPFIYLSQFMHWNFLHAICHWIWTGTFFFLDIISHRIWTGTVCALFSAECALELSVHRLSQNIRWNFLHTIYHKIYTGIFCIPFITKYALELSRYHLSPNMHLNILNTIYHRLHWSFLYTIYHSLCTGAFLKGLAFSNKYQEWAAHNNVMNVRRDSAAETWTAYSNYCLPCE